MTVVNVQQSSHQKSPEHVMHIILAGAEKERLADLASGLWTSLPCEIEQLASSAEVLSILEQGRRDLVIVDEQLKDRSGLELAQEIARSHPFVDCIMIDGSSPEDFHEKTEGLGVLLQLPSPPTILDAESVVAHLRAIHECVPTATAVSGRGV